MQKSPVLISWIAFNNDPYERDPTTRKFRLINGKKRIGPTLNLLAQIEEVKEVVLLCQEGEIHRKTFVEIKEAIKETLGNIKVSAQIWHGNNPTDHKDIFQFLQKKMPLLRSKYEGRELLIHISPGTPAMQTIWILMAETGFIAPPFRIVQSYRRGEVPKSKQIAEVDIGIETFYKMYISGSKQFTQGKEEVVWDPGLFSPRLKQL